MIPLVEVPYEEKIHKALTDKVEGFSMPLDTFKERMKDPEYQLKIHRALSDKVEGFSLPVEAFTSKFQKKSPFQPGYEDDIINSAPPSASGEKPFNEEEDKKNTLAKLASESGQVIDAPKIVAPTGELGRKTNDKEIIPFQDGMDLSKEKPLTPEEEKNLLKKPEISSDEAVGSFAGSFNKPFIDLVASAPKAAAFVKKGIDELAGVNKGKLIEEYDAYQLGHWIEDKALAVGLGATNPKVEQTFLGGKAPHAFGAALSLIMTGGSGGGSAALGRELITGAEQGAFKGALKEMGHHMTSRAGISGGNVMGMSEFEQAKAAGASDEDAFGVYLKNFGVGTTAAVPISRGFARINQFTEGGVVNALKKSATQSLEMGVQGGVQSYLTNKIAQGSYDPKRESFKDLLDQVGVQMFVGMVLPGIQGAYKKMSPKQVQETKSNIHKALKDYESAQKGPTTEAAKAIEAQKTIENTEPVAQTDQTTDTDVSGIEPVIQEPGPVSEPVSSKPAPSKTKKVNSQIGTKSQKENISQNAPRETVKDEPAEPTIGNVRDEDVSEEPTGSLSDSGTSEPSVEETNGEEPSNRGVDKPGDTRTGTKVKFEWLGSVMTGEVIGPNASGTRVRIKGDDGTTYPVAESAIQSERNSLIPKTTLKEVNKNLDALVKTNSVKDPVKEGKILASTINPLIPIKKAWVLANKGQEKLFAENSRKVENWIAKKVTKGLEHNNFWVRNAVGTAQNLMGGLAYTDHSLSNKLKYIGAKNAGHLLTHRLAKEMYAIIDSNPGSLVNLHAALDPEVYVNTTPEGKDLLREAASLKKTISGKHGQLNRQLKTDPENITEVDKIEREIEDAQDALESKNKEIEKYSSQIGTENLSKLNDQEKALHELIMQTNEYGHNWWHDQGIISDQTYNKFKGKYIARMYEEFELIPPDVEQAFQSSRPDFNAFKERKDFEDVDQSIVRDPVYLTVKRYGQMLQAQALFDYAYNVNKNPNIQVSDTPFPNSTQMGQPGGKPFYGELTGKYIPNYIAQDIKGYFFANKWNQKAFELVRRYDQLGARQFLKRYHTVYNPMVQVGNKLSNYAFSFWCGVDPITFTRNKFRAGNELNAQKGLRYEELMSRGGIGTDLLSNELKPFSLSSLTSVKGFIGGQGTNLPAAPASKPKTLLGKVGKVIKSIPEKAEQYYGRADDEAKLAAFISLREDYGYSADKAAQKVYESFQNYATVGKLYDFAAKTPIIGNPYIKFKADLARIIKNGVSRHPLTTAAWAGSLVALSKYLSKESGEDERVRLIRERREFQPKILGVIPLSMQVPHVGEVNMARFISPYYSYDKGENDNMVASTTDWLPFQADLGPDASKDLRSLTFSTNDVFLGTYWQAIWADRDFRGKSIQDPKGTKYLSHDTDMTSRTLNALNYISRSQVPMFASAQDMLNAYNGEADYYGRERTVSQAILNNIIKVQEFGAPEAREALSKEIRFKVSKFENLSRDIGSVKSDASRTIEKIEASNLPAQVKDRRVREEIERVQKAIAERTEAQVKIVKELEEPMKLMSSIKDLK